MAHGLLALLAAAMPAGTALDDEVGTELDRALAEARAAWPGVTVAPEALVPVLAQELSRDATRAPLEVLRGLHVRDLYLAAACAVGDAAALRAVDAYCSGAIRDVVRRIGSSAALGDETVQVTRELLFVKKGDAPPKVSKYAGRGDLRSWTMVVAAREALRIAKAEARQTPALASKLLDAASVAEADIELDYLKRTYRPEFERALADALAALPSRDRALLKYHYVDGLNGRRIAALHQVHPATVTRWLEAARQALADGTHALLQERLGVGSSELASLERLVSSQLELSLSRQLGSKADAG
ncbi:MAG: sigma factor-like helix-turn-helix DNA-binding protein [Polyangiaceae bacterium]